MGTRKKFSAAEQELLRANPYTEKVTEHQISFTLAFKEAFWRLSVEGCTGNMALRKLGYDPELLGFERIHNITKRIRRAGKSPEGIQPAPKSRMRISREQFGAAELEKCPAGRVSAGCSRKSCIFSSRWRFKNRKLHLQFADFFCKFLYKSGAVCYNKTDYEL